MTEYQIDVFMFMGIWLVGMLTGALILYPFEKKKPGVGAPGQRNRK